MADVIDLSRQRVINAPSKHTKGIQQVLEEVAERNAKEEIRSIVVMSVDYNGGIWFDSIRESTDDPTFIGQIEIIKSDLIARVQSRRALIIEEGDNE